MIDHEKKLEKAKKNLNDSNILEVNKKHILSFVNAADSGLTRDGKPVSKRRQFKYVNQLRKMALMLDKDFNKATKEDIVDLNSKINNMKRTDGKLCTEWTRYTYKIVLKTFYKYLNGGEEYPKCIKWIKPKIEKRTKTEPSDVLTFDDVKELANATENLRDRAFILFLYESGCRIGELMSIRIKDFTTPDQYGSMMHIPEGKTGPRDIRIISSSPAISNWLTQHPTRNDTNSLIFCGISNFNKGKPIEYNNYRKVLIKAKAKTNIQKPVNPHNFRHSRATELCKKLTEAVLCKYMGWVIGSKEAATYVHLNSDEVRDAYDEIHGVKKPDEKKMLKPIQCPRCNTNNDAAARVCSGCSLGLDEKSIFEYDLQKEQAAQIGIGIQQAMQKDELYQMMFKKMQDMEKQLTELQNKKK